MINAGARTTHVAQRKGEVHREHKTEVYTEIERRLVRACSYGPREGEGER